MTDIATSWQQAQHGSTNAQSVSASQLPDSKCGTTRGQAQSRSSSGRKRSTRRGYGMTSPMARPDPHSVADDAQRPLETRFASSEAVHFGEALAAPVHKGPTLRESLPPSVR